MVLTHPVSRVSHHPLSLQLQKAGECAVFGQGRFDARRVVDKHAVEIISAQDFQLVLYIPDYPFGRKIGLAVTPVAAPWRIRVAAETARNNDILARDLAQRKTQLAQRVSVAAGAVKMIHAQRHGMFDQGNRVLVADKTKMVAKALRAEGNDGNL